MRVLPGFACLVLAASAPAQFSVSGPGGMIPLGNIAGWDTANLDHDFTLTDPPGVSAVMVPVPVVCIDSVVIQGLDHTWPGDVQCVLFAPNGVGWNIWLRPEMEPGTTCCGNGEDMLGDYIFVEPGTAANGPLPEAGPIPAGTYDQSWETHDSVNNLVWPNGDENVFNVPLSGISGPAGMWELHFYDWFAADDGSFTGWTLNGNTCAGGSLGTNICMTAPNSNGSGAVMSASGSTSVAANDLVLTAIGGSTGQPAIFYYGENALAGAPFGEGFRCAGGTTIRLQPFVVSDANGTFTKVVDNQIPLVMGSMAPIVDMATLTFQCWYRDPDCVGPTTLMPGDCNDDGAPSGFNLSDGYTITFTP